MDPTEQNRKSPTSNFQKPPFNHNYRTNRPNGKFLDVTLSTDNGSYKPYKKPNSKISYVNRASNHPPSILKNIPSSIQKRLTTISSSKQEYLEAKNEYEKALKDAGYTEVLKYEPNDNSPQATKKET